MVQFKTTKLQRILHFREKKQPKLTPMQVAAHPSRGARLWPGRQQRVRIDKGVQPVARLKNLSKAAADEKCSRSAI